MANEKGYYANVGESFEWYCKEKQAPEGTILMEGPRPNETATAQLNGTWFSDTPEMQAWEATMRASDSLMTRESEDFWTAIGRAKIPGYWLQKYDEKLMLRADKP